MEIVVNCWVRIAIFWKFVQKQEFRTQIGKILIEMKKLFPQTYLICIGTYSSNLFNIIQ